MWCCNEGACDLQRAYDKQTRSNSNMPANQSVHCPISFRLMLYSADYGINRYRNFPMLRISPLPSQPHTHSKPTLCAPVTRGSVARSAAPLSTVWHGTVWHVLTRGHFWGGSAIDFLWRWIFLHEKNVLKTAVRAGTKHQATGWP